MSEPNYFYLPFLKKEQRTADTYSFYFKRTGEERDFVAGQYFEIKLNIKNPDDRDDTRVFTMSSSPTDKDYFMITTRIIQSAFKKALYSLKPGTLVRFDGPWNDLNVDENPKPPKVFLAGGIGVTPFHSIVKYCLDKNLDLPMTLFVSWSKKEEMVFDDFFTEAAESLHNFIYIPTITHPETEDNWKGETGRIDKAFLEKHLVNQKQYKYYIAGPPTFVKAEKELLLGIKIPDKSIIAEEFEGY